MHFRINMVVLVFTIIQACNNAPDDKNSMQKSVIKTNLFDDNSMILLVSCIRCSCINTDLPKSLQGDTAFFSRIYLVADTNCTRIGRIKNHIPQAAIDSISDSFYNIILLKRTTGNEYYYRIIETKESRNLLSICRAFYKPNLLGRSEN